MIVKQYSKTYAPKDKQNGKGTAVNKKCYQSSEENKWMEEGRCICGTHSPC